MKWSWKVGSFAGIPVYIHATFLLILGWVALSSWLELGTAAGVIGGLAFILALFASVVLHEYGHALTARRFGIKTSDITTATTYTKASDTFAYRNWGHFCYLCRTGDMFVCRKFIVL